MLPIQAATPSPKTTHTMSGPDIPMLIKTQAAVGPYILVLNQKKGKLLIKGVISLTLLMLTKQTSCIYKWKKTK